MKVDACVGQIAMSEEHDTKTPPETSERVNSINRRRLIKGLGAAGFASASPMATGMASAQQTRLGEDIKDSKTSENADQEFANSRFKERSAALDDVSVIKESNALHDLHQKVIDSTGRAVEDVLPLSIELTTNNEDVNELNPSLAVSLLKDTSTTWNNTTPRDLGVLVAGVVDEPESGVHSDVSVQVRDGTNRIPVSAGAVTLHDEPSGSASPSRSKHGNSKTLESNDEIQYRLFSYEKGNGVVQSQQQGRLPDPVKPTGTVSSQSSKLPPSLTPEVVESYQPKTC